MDLLNQSNPSHYSNSQKEERERERERERESMFSFVDILAIF